MAYYTSPMEQYNKSNPFIIVAKRKYDQIIDDIQSLTRRYLMVLIVLLLTFILWVPYFIIALVVHSKAGLFFVLCGALMCGVVVSYRKYKSMTAYYLYEHPAMKKFDTLANLEVNDILALDNIEILNCNNEMYFMHGALQQDYRYMTTATELLALINILSAIFAIVTLFILQGGIC